MMITISRKLSKKGDPKVTVIVATGIWTGHDDEEEERRDEEYHHNYDRKGKRTRSHHRKGHKMDYDDRRDFYDERPLKGKPS